MQSKNKLSVELKQTSKLSSSRLKSGLMTFLTGWGFSFSLLLSNLVLDVSTTNKIGCVKLMQVKIYLFSTAVWKGSTKVLFTDVKYQQTRKARGGAY